MYNILHISPVPLLLSVSQINLIQSYLAFAPLYWQVLLFPSWQNITQPTIVTKLIRYQELTDIYFHCEKPRSTCHTTQAILNESHMNRNIEKRSLLACLPACLLAFPSFLLSPSLSLFLFFSSSCYQNFLLACIAENLSMSNFPHITLIFKGPYSAL